MCKTCEPATDKRNCDRCGTSFAPKMSKQRWCSKRCRDLSSYEGSGRSQCQCRVCGKSFIPKASNRTTVCSRECGFIRTAAQLTARNVARNASLRERKRLRLLFERLRTCRICRLPFLVKHGRTTCGNPYCVTLGRLTSGQIELVKPCKTCGRDIGPPARGQHRSHYCPQCKDEAARAARRRAKHQREGRLGITSKGSMKRAATIRELRAFIDRVGCQCPACGLLMVRGIDPSSDRALELDHAIPISKGGEDAWPNIRPLCRRCNGLKRDFAAPDVVIGAWITEQEGNHALYS